MEERLLDIVNSFPPCDVAIAYGSGVFSQPGLYHDRQTFLNNERPMLDFIFATKDPLLWHQQNLENHRHHYSFLGLLGSQAITSVANNIGIGVYFNPYVRMKDSMLKYGVVSLSTLENDLNTWSSLYLAGRLHKPVLHLMNPVPSTIQEAQEHNVLSAVRSALLLLPSHFQTKELLKVICGISYAGDIRVMLAAEDNRKVERIVSGSEERLRKLFQKPLETASAQWGLLSKLGSDSWEQNTGIEARKGLMCELPRNVLAKLGVRPEVVAELPRSRGNYMLRKALASIVLRSSVRQAVAGMLSAGVVKSASYSFSKLRKGWGWR